MAIALRLVLLLSLAGCAGIAQRPTSGSPCQTQGEASYACQIERYDRAAA